MQHYFPIPPGADAKSEKAIKDFQTKLGHLVISKEEIQFIVDGVMKAQKPRDQERLRKEEEKRQREAERQRAVARRRQYA